MCSRENAVFTLHELKLCLISIVNNRFRSHDSFSSSYLHRHKCTYHCVRVNVKMVGEKKKNKKWELKIETKMATTREDEFDYHKYVGIFKTFFFLFICMYIKSVQQLPKGKESIFTDIFVDFSAL